jgi:hypothetical protein
MKICTRMKMCVYVRRYLKLVSRSGYLRRNYTPYVHTWIPSLCRLGRGRGFLLRCNSLHRGPNHVLACLFKRGTPGKSTYVPVFLRMCTNYLWVDCQGEEPLSGHWPQLGVMNWYLLSSNLVCNCLLPYSVEYVRWGPSTLIAVIRTRNFVSAYPGVPL